MRPIWFGAIALSKGVEMNDVFALVEQGLDIAQLRAAMLAADAANARSTGFVARDVRPVVEASEGGLRFAAAVDALQPAGTGGVVEYAMGATAENSIRFRALAEQERSMLREFRTVAEEARR
jgi:flagellar basal body rod protein FlgB